MTSKVINLKLRDATAANATLSRLSQIPGIKKIERLFPNETDPELAALYIASVEPSNADSVLKQLQADPDVEFAEFPPRRKLI